MKKTIIILTAILLLTGCGHKKTNETSKVEVKKAEVTLKEGQDLKVEDIIKPEAGFSYEFKVKPDTTKVGKQEVIIIKKNNQDNSTQEEKIEVTLIKPEVKKEEPKKDEVKKEEPKKEDSKQTNTPTTNKEDSDKQTSSQPATPVSSGVDESLKIVQLAREIEGDSGVCSEITRKLLSRYYGGNGATVEQGKTPISMSEAKPGDIVVYNFDGTSNDHIAVYLGNGMALQGNLGAYDHKAKIASVYINNLSDPVFFRYEDVKYVSPKAAKYEEPNNYQTMTKEDCEYLRNNWQAMSDEEFDAFYAKFGIDQVEAVCLAD